MKKILILLFFLNSPTGEGRSAKETFFSLFLGCMNPEKTQRKINTDKENGSYGSTSTNTCFNGSSESLISNNSMYTAHGSEERLNKIYEKDFYPKKKNWLFSALVFNFPAKLRSSN